jgi:predicted DNA-binding ribbon-helix-helix protein
MPALSKRSFTISGHRTSIALEDEFWRALERIAESEAISLAALVARVDHERETAAFRRGLASALRVFALTRLDARTRRP